jgi:hypothetical protein
MLGQEKEIDVAEFEEINKLILDLFENEKYFYQEKLFEIIKLSTYTKTYEQRKKAVEKLIELRNL